MTFEIYRKLFDIHLVGFEVHNKPNKLSFFPRHRPRNFMAKPPWQLGPQDYQNLTSCFALYFPSDAEGGVMRRPEAQEALQWCMAFTYLAFNPTAAPEVPGALQIRRPRFSLDQLRTFRTSQGAPSEVIADLSKRLMTQPEKFLAEVGLGFDLAHLLLQRHNPQLSESMHSAARPIDVELVAPELEQAVQSVRSELIDRYVARNIF